MSGVGACRRGRGRSRRVRVALAFALAVIGLARIGADQNAGRLAALTVPADRLPAGCGLEPAEPPPATVAPPGRVTVLNVEPGRPPTNPWSGVDPTFVRFIRERIDGDLRMPDGPPLDRTAMAALHDQWNRHVIEAYRATYAAGQEPPVDVFAVRFDDAALAQAAPLVDATRPDRVTFERIVVGASVVAVRSSAAGRCYRGIVDYVRTLR